MCKDKKVLDLDNYGILSPELLPGYMHVHGVNKHTFTKWMHLRYSSSSNTLARKLRGITFGQGNRQKINELSYALSLTDCYWLKKEDENVSFDEVSPYFNEFWKGSEEYKRQAVPTLYVDGSLPKEWRSKDILFKMGKLSIELEVIELCKACGIMSESGRSVENGIEVFNFTTPDIMFESAAASGRFDEEDFTDIDIVNEFGVRGAEMLVIDAITGDGDRHAGNFGYLRDSGTGDYLGMAPLYDFDHSLDSSINDRADRLVTDMLEACSAYPDVIKRISETALVSGNKIFAQRAGLILRLLKGSSGSH